MPRKFKSTAHFLKPDPKYHDMLIAKFVNCLMYDGKKSTAQKIIYDAIEALGKKHPKEKPLKLFKDAIENVKPEIEVRSRRVGGATYQVPTEVNPKRRQSLAIRWILQSTRSRSGKPMAQRLAEELIDAYRGEGTAMKKRENVHKMAEANKAFAHFAWS